MTVTTSTHPSALLARCIVAFGVALGLVVASLGPTRVQARDIPGSFADLAERLSPAVVNISTSQTVDRPDVDALPDGPFNELFREFFERGQPQGPRQVQSLGSGFVISADGYVVTNNHVISEADEVTVNFPDGLSLKAEIIGTDDKTDLAVLKVEADRPLPFVPWGDSAVSRVGDWVLAIGNPFGLGGSVSAGIISARNRDIRAGPYDDFLQTDAAINRGNSGGPLFNLAGQVIGVNTAIISPTGGSIGIGFAVPARLAQNVVQQLREFGETRRGWLGVRIQEVTDEISEALELDAAKGALVASVTSEGPAEEAGIQPGDVITRFDGREVEAMRDLPRMVAETPVGKSVRVVVFRKGKTVTLKVKLGRLEGQGVASASAGAPGQEDTTGADVLEIAEVGLSLEALSDAGRAKFGIGKSIEGVLISAVAKDTPAAEKGLKPGDVIVEIGQDPVTDPKVIAARIENARSDGRATVLMLVQSGEDLKFVPLGTGL